MARKEADARDLRGGRPARGSPFAASSSWNIFTSAKSLTPTPHARFVAQVHLYMPGMYYLQMYEQAEKEATRELDRIVCARALTRCARLARALAVGRRYTAAASRAALRREVEEKTTPAAIQKRRKEMQSEEHVQGVWTAETTSASKVA